MGTTDRLARRMEHWMRTSTLQVRITHPTPSSAADLPIDPNTDEIVDAAADGVVYEGPALRTRGFARQAGEAEIGGTAVAVDTDVLHLPRSATPPEEGDQVLITVCPGDPPLVGRRMRVTEVNRLPAPLVASRRLVIEEVSPARAGPG